MSGIATIPGDIYAWTVVFLLPVNSALNPILYTMSSLKAKVNRISSKVLRKGVGLRILPLRNAQSV